MTTRHAACNCGQLHLTVEGEPVRVSVCHCRECQRRTGAVFASNARFPREQITVAGRTTEWTRTADSGSAITFRFCPVCGATVYWTGESFPGLVAVAIGTFADPAFPAPKVSVYERARIRGWRCRATRRWSGWSRAAPPSCRARLHPSGADATEGTRDRRGDLRG